MNDDMKKEQLTEAQEQIGKEDRSLARHMKV